MSNNHDDRIETQPLVVARAMSGVRRSVPTEASGSGSEIDRRTLNVTYAGDTTPDNVEPAVQVILELEAAGFNIFSDRADVGTDPDRATANRARRAPPSKVTAAQFTEKERPFAKADSGGQRHHFDLRKDDASGSALQSTGAVDSAPLAGYYPCGTCSRVFPTEQSLAKHKAMCARYSNIRDKSETSAKSTNNSGSDSRLMCDMCDQVFNTKALRETHELWCKGTKRLCHACGYVFENSRQQHLAKCVLQVSSVVPVSIIRTKGPPTAGTDADGGNAIATLVPPKASSQIVEPESNRQVVISDGESQIFHFDLDDNETDGFNKQASGVPTNVDGTPRVDQYSCDGCQRTFPRKQSLGRHMQCCPSRMLQSNLRTDGPSVRKLLCDMCGKLLLTTTDLEKHKQWCLRCGWVNATEEERGKQCAVQGTLSCDGCDKRYQSLASLRRHKKFCPTNSPSVNTTEEERRKQFVIQGTLSCDGCDKRYQWLKSLRRHKLLCPTSSIVQKPVTDGSFPCDMCDRVLSTPAALRTHQRSCRHLTAEVRARRCAGIRTYTCNACDKSFQWESSLTQHQQECAQWKNGLGEPSASEEQGVSPPKSTGATQSIESEVDSPPPRVIAHVDDDPSYVPGYTCSKCKRVLSSPQGHSAHERVCSGRRSSQPVASNSLQSYTCACGRTFAVKQGFGGHVAHCKVALEQRKTHELTDRSTSAPTSEVIGYPCATCSGVFSSKQALGTHRYTCRMYQSKRTTACRSSSSALHDAPPTKRNSQSPPPPPTDDDCNSVLSCRPCGTVFQSAEELAEHSAACTGAAAGSTTTPMEPPEVCSTQTYYMCDSCERTFERQSDLHEHEKECQPVSEHDEVTDDGGSAAHGSDERVRLGGQSAPLPPVATESTIRRFPCVCGRTFLANSGLGSHKRVCLKVKQQHRVTSSHGRNDSFACLCGCTFQTKQGLGKHRTTCQFASKQPTTETSTESAAATSDVIGYPCSTCHGVYASKFALGAHQYRCIEYHTKRPSASSSSTAAHGMPLPKRNRQSPPSTDGSNSVFNCQSCADAFQSAEALAVHSKACSRPGSGATWIARRLSEERSAETLYLCDYCELSFERLDDLKKHERECHQHAPVPDEVTDDAADAVDDGTPFFCKMCGQSFRGHYTLVAHLPTCQSFSRVSPRSPPASAELTSPNIALRVSVPQAESASTERNRRRPVDRDDLLSCTECAFVCNDRDTFTAHVLGDDHHTVSSTDKSLMDARHTAADRALHTEKASRRDSTSARIPSRQMLECDDCGYRFVSEGSLKIHRRRFCTAGREVGGV